MILVFCHELPLFLFTNLRSISSRQSSRQAFLNGLCPPVSYLWPRAVFCSSQGRPEFAFFTLPPATWTHAIPVPVLSAADYERTSQLPSGNSYDSPSSPSPHPYTTPPPPHPHPPRREILGSSQSPKHSVNRTRQCYQNNVTSRYGWICQMWLRNKLIRDSLKGGFTNDLPTIIMLVIVVNIYVKFTLLHIWF